MLPRERGCRGERARGGVTPTARVTASGAGSAVVEVVEVEVVDVAGAVVVVLVVVGGAVTAVVASVPPACRQDHDANTPPETPVVPAQEHPELQIQGERDRAAIEHNSRGGRGWRRAGAMATVPSVEGAVPRRRVSASCGDRGRTDAIPGPSASRVARVLAAPSRSRSSRHVLAAQRCPDRSRAGRPLHLGGGSGTAARGDYRADQGS